jgi:hypothetical protein
MIMKVEQDNITLPLVRLDGSLREVSIVSNHLKLSKFTDKDDLKPKVRDPFKSVDIEMAGNKQVDITYFVGDIVIYGLEKFYGYIIKAETESVQVINEFGRVADVRKKEIDKKL